MAIRKRGAGHLADFMVKGVRYRATFLQRDDAEQWETEVRHELRLGRPAPTPMTGKGNGHELGTLEKLLSHVRAHRWDKKRGSEGTALNARQVVRILGPQVHPRDVTKMSIELLVSELYDNGNALSTVNRKMSALRTLLTEAREHGVIESVPKIPHGKELCQEIRFLTHAEEARLIDALTWVGRKDWVCFVRMAVDTGMRVGELMSLRWEHLSPSGDIAHVWKTKSNKPRSIPLTKRAIAALNEMQLVRPDCSGPFFHLKTGNVMRRKERNIWNHATTAAKIDKRIHDLRHTCASRLVQKGVDLLRVKDWMGHSEIATTLRYAHLAPNDLQVCRRALEGETIAETMGTPE